MPRRRTKIDSPFDTHLEGEKLNEFATFWTDELEAGLRARSELMDDYGLIDLWHSLYEQQARNRQGPWPGSADLGSYIGTEKVDATRAKLVKIIAKAEPICVVEGRGASVQKAPHVEEAHEWLQQTQERLFVSLVRWFHQALIERIGIMETYEHVERVVTVTERDLLVEVDPANVDAETGRPAILLKDGEPVPIKGTDSKYIDARAPDEPQAKVKVREVKYVHHGPRQRIISGKDFVWLPAHAKDRENEVIGYFKRVYLTNAQLAERVEQGIYDKAAVEKLGKSGQQETTATEERARVSVQQTGHEATERHELWEGQIYADLDGDGPRWHLVTLSQVERVVLRLKDDTINRCRFHLLCLFVKIQGVDGYSFIGDKLFTLIEEHASQRNQITDRSTMAVNAPILRMNGSKWNPQLHPWAPRRVITVDHKDEITQAQIRDVPESAIVRERMTLTAVERVSGAPDIVSSGVVEGANPTATQVAQSAAAGNARLEEQVALAQEAIEPLYEVRHLIWIRALEFNGGMEVDASLVQRMAGHGLELEDGQITADMLKGTYRFKPRGSVESSDPVLQQRKFEQRWTSLFGMAKFVPALQQRLQDPAVGDAILQDWADVYKPRDRQAFLKPTRPAMPPQAGPFGPPGGPPQDEGAAAVPPGLLAMLGKAGPMVGPQPQGAM